MDDKHTNKPRVSRKLALISMIVLSTVLFGIVLIRSLLHVQTPAELAAQQRQDKEAAEKPGDPAEERDREQSQLQRAQREADAARAASEAASKAQASSLPKSIEAPLPEQFAKPPAQSTPQSADTSQWHSQGLAAYEANSSGKGNANDGGPGGVDSQLQRLHASLMQTMRTAQDGDAPGDSDAASGDKRASASPDAAVKRALSLSETLKHALGDGGNVSSTTVNAGDLPESSKSVGPSNAKWLQMQNTGAGSQTVALRAVPSKSPYILQETGTMHVVFLQGLNSDLPTEIRAMVTQDVYDTITGTHLLIPKGSVLAAKVNTDVARGQDRMMIAFTRLFLRGGSSVNLGAMSGADAQGYAGLNANVNRHLFARFGAAFLIALVETAANRGSGSTTISIGSSVSSAGSTGLSEVTQAVLNSNINIQDTLTVKPGAEMTVVVTRDLVLPPETTGIYQ